MLETSLPLWVLLFLFSKTYLEGLEELFILPTAWEYIKSLGGTETYLGVVLGSYSLMNMIINPIIGKVHDTFGNTKLIIVLSCFFKALAQLIYSIPRKEYPLIGRVLSGISGACFGVIFDVAASSTPAHIRGKTFVILDGILVIGTVTGPVIGSFLIFNVDIYGWKINAGNASPFVLGIIYSGLFVASLWLPKQFARGNGKDNEEFLCKEEVELRSYEEPPQKTYASNTTIMCVQAQIFMYTFLPSICQFYIPLFARERFHLESIDTKMLFLIFCLTDFIVEICIYLMSGHSSQRKIIYSMFFFQLVGIVILVLLSLNWQNTSVYNAYIFMIYAIIGAISFCTFPVSCSLVARITNPDQSSFYQGCCFSSLFLGALTARFISGFFFTQMSLLFYAIELL